MLSSYTVFNLGQKYNFLNFKVPFGKINGRNTWLGVLHFIVVQVDW